MTFVYSTAVHNEKSIELNSMIELKANQLVFVILTINKFQVLYFKLQDHQRSIKLWECFVVLGRNPRELKMISLLSFSNEMYIKTIILNLY